MNFHITHWRRKDLKQSFQILKALLIAPLAVPLAVYPIRVIYGFLNPNIGIGQALVESTMASLVGMVFAFIATLLVGLPIHLMLQRLEFTSWIAYLLAGPIAGMVFFGTLLVMEPNPDNKFITLLDILQFMILPSASVSMVFWAVAGRNRT